NIFDAQVIPMSPTINGYLSHQLTLNVTPMSTTMGNSIPPVVRFRVAGEWDPADFMGRVKESFLGYIVIRSDGMVRIQNMRSDMVSPTDLIPVSGPSVGGCEPLFRRFRQAASAPALPQPMGAGAASPRSVSPTPRAGNGGRSSRRRPPRLGYRPRGAPADPPNGKHVFFRTGSARATSEIRALIQQWWARLRPNIQSAISSGRIVVRAIGHADPTGPENRNRALSHQRAAMVAGLIRAVAGAGANVQFQGVGSSQARAAGVPSGVSDRTWRRVTISLDTGGPLI
ncbi:MAG: hypothetical protein AAGF20_10360, partial [Pseudomonadota bacterium]